MDSEKVEIVWTDWGLADRIDNDILINKALKKDKELLDFVILHEKGHTSGTNFKKEDLYHDFVILPKDIFFYLRLFLFQLKNPKTLTQLLPARLYKKELYWDISNLLTWLFIIALFYLI